MIRRGLANNLDEEVIEQIVGMAGSNLIQLRNLAVSREPRKSVEKLIQWQTRTLRVLFVEDEKAYELLLMIAKGEKILVDHGEKLHMLLLTLRENFDAICGVHPDGHLILSMPVTKIALEILQKEKSEALQISEKVKDAK